MNYTHVYIKARHVRARIYGNPSTYEGTIIGRKSPGVWDTLARSRGHLTMREAIIAIGKVADRRKLKVVDDPRALRAIEFADRYGDVDP